MTNYTGNALEKLNPCGIENNPSTYCQYLAECRTLGQTSGRFVCLSKTGYETAKYLLKGNDEKTETKDLREVIKSHIDSKVIDPTKKSWTPTAIKSAHIGNIVNTIISRAQEFYHSASAVGNDNNPLKFDCDVNAIVKDLA